MAQNGVLLAIDQGTSSSRVLAFDREGREILRAQRAVDSTYPQDGWVEQDAEELWQTVRECLLEVLAQLHGASIISLGITNQREATVAWDRDTGRALAPVISWQCRRTATRMRELKNDGKEQFVRERTGLVLDAYFSASKMEWLLRNVSAVQAAAAKNVLALGTIDSWVLYRLSKEFSGSAVFSTEPSNASRTMLYDIRSLQWSDELCAEFHIPKNSLASVCPTFSRFADLHIGGKNVPVHAILGDQQAALFGQGCFSFGEAKCTFGTGAFLLLNAGDGSSRCAEGLLKTVAWQAQDSSPVFAFEGSVFIAGKLIQWLRDKLGILASAAQSQALAESVGDSGGVVVVPAFVGLGAPYWDSTVRAAIFGMTLETSAAHIVRASLDAVAHQVADLLELGGDRPCTELRIDGGMSANRFFAQRLADITGVRVLSSPQAECTALGAALGAGFGSGVFSSLEEVARVIGEVRKETAAQTVQPALEPQKRAQERRRWKDAISLLRQGAS